MKALITNVFSNINYDLCCHLLEEGNEVIGIDDISDGEDKAWKEDRYLRIGRNANFHFINEEITSIPSEERKAIEEIDVIFQIAHEEDKSYYSATQKSEKLNNLFALIKESNARIVYLSSLAIYGNLYGDIDETTSTRPTTPFGFRVYYEEKKVKENQESPYVILRCPVIYGPWFTKRRLKSLNESNEVIYIDDVIKALLLAAESKHTNETYNIVPSINIGKKTYHFSNEKAKGQLGFQQTVSLAKGKRILYNANKSKSTKKNN
jgi:UDP-glucose 4-epimerase